jgi:hypothetical protein
VSYVTVSLPQLLLSLGLMAMAIAISAQESPRPGEGLALGTVRARYSCSRSGWLLTSSSGTSIRAGVFGVIA